MIQVDSALALKSGRLSGRIGEAAARAAEILLSQSPFPEGSLALREYRNQFMDVYGHDIEVPVLELLSPELGLDAPDGYTQPPRLATRSLTPPRHERRERLFQRLVQEALNRHDQEIVLSQAQLEALQTWKPDPAQAPRSLEIYLQIQAASEEALSRGQFCAVVGINPGSPNAGRTFGRFFDLLGEKGLSYLKELLRKEEALSPETIFAELSYQHQQARASNLTMRPGLRHYEIAVGTTPSVPPENVIPLSDLVVGVRNGRFYLRSLRHNKRVVVCQLHMLSMLQAPNVCRFLSELSSDGLPMLSSFDWGLLASAPFLPRLVVQLGGEAQLVLAPACWNLSRETIAAQGQQEARAALQAWRKQWRVPRYVYLTEMDNRLLLDLEHPLMMAELQKELAGLPADHSLTLQECLPDFEHLWLSDTRGERYFSEFVVPLLRSDAFKEPEKAESEKGKRPEKVAQPGVTTLSSVPHVVAPGVRLCYPGEQWSYVKLYCTPTQQEEVLAGPLQDLLRTFNETRACDHWFYIRYADPDHHLRLRLHAATPEQPVLTNLLAWSRTLARRGLIQRYTLDTYAREVGRYGGPAAIELLEQTFSIDSEFCRGLVAALYEHHLTLSSMEIAVLSSDHYFAALGYDLEQRLHWLEERVEKYAWSREYHAERKRYCELFAPWDVSGRGTIDQPTGGAMKKPAAFPDLAEQREKFDLLCEPLKQLPPLAVRIRELAQSNQLWVSEEELLGSLAHMHKIRLLDLDGKREQQLCAFWLHTLKSIRYLPARRE